MAEKGSIKIEEEKPGIGTVSISCQELIISDGKIELKMDETNLFDYKTIKVTIGKKTTIFKQA